MKHNAWIIAAIILIFTSCSFAAEKTIAESAVREKPLPSLIKNKLFFSSDYDYGWVHINSRRGKWGLSSNTLAYAASSYFTPYLNINAWDRLHVKNTTLNAGAYLKFKDLSYILSEIGFGSQITYVYRFQTLLEYNHRLQDNYFYFLGCRYLNYADNDVFIVYPGIRYYFGDNYVSVSYNTAMTESRGQSRWVLAKGNFYLTRSLTMWLGAAIGERLYDINILPANKQYGYIIFMGTNTKITDALDLKLGFSYSRERPAFIKRSLEFGMAYKF